MIKCLNRLLKSKPFNFLKILTSLLFLFVIHGCGLFSPNDEKGENKVIARVQDKYLYEKDLKEMFSKNPMVSKQDSLALREKFIDNWIEEKLIFKKALDNLPKAKTKKDKALQNYYESLIRHEYEQALINKKLDTSVSKTALMKFYNNHNERFTLKQDVIKCRYLILPLNTPRKKKVKTWLKASENFYLDSLYQYGRRFAKKFNLKANNWHYYSKIRKKLNLPQQTSDQLFNQVKKNEVIETKDSNSHYFIYVTDLKQEKEKAPFQLKRGTIKSALLNKKKMELIRKMEKKVVQKGLEQNDVKRYD